MCILYMYNNITKWYGPKYKHIQRVTLSFFFSLCVCVFFEPDDSQGFVWFASVVVSNYVITCPVHVELLLYRMDAHRIYALYIHIFSSKKKGELTHTHTQTQTCTYVRTPTTRSYSLAAAWPYGGESFSFLGIFRFFFYFYHTREHSTHTTQKY